MYFRESGSEGGWVMPRPPKYNGRMAHISLYLPISLLDELDRVAKSTQTSRNQVIVSMIMSADKALAESILRYYQEIRAEIRRTAERIDPVNVFVRVQAPDIPEEIKTDPEFLDAIRRARAVLKKGQTVKSVLEWLVPEVEDIALRHGYTIRHRQLLRAYLISLLSSTPS